MRNNQDQDATIAHQVNSWGQQQTEEEVSIAKS